MIIIPDIHGRSFWKEAVKGHEDDEIIFLGDYLDPYLDEWDTEGETSDERLEKRRAVAENAIYNFKDIIEFKKEHPDNVILLIGNHDLEYFYSPRVCDCRRDIANYEWIQNIFRDNAELFQLAYQKVINDKQYVFTHAGIRKHWADEWIQNYVEDIIVDKLNALHKSCVINGYGTDFEFALSECSFYRGGWDICSSPVWTDIRELASVDNEFNFYQIVGHTRAYEPIVTKNFAMLDAQRAFILNEEGVITRMDGVPVPITIID